jgi:hypothetical protein
LAHGSVPQEGTGGVGKIASAIASSFRKANAAWDKGVDKLDYIWGSWPVASARASGRLRFQTEKDPNGLPQVHL